MRAPDPFAEITQSNVLQAFHHGMALQKQGRPAEAAELWSRIATAAPASPEARFNLGVALFELERFEEAEAAFRRAIEMKPAAAWAHCRLGNFLHAVGRWPEAEESYQLARSFDPTSKAAQLDLAHLYLGLGDYERGWPLYEVRKDVPGHSAEPLPLPGEWQGEPLEGRKLLIWPEQGYGDQIQFARFVPELVARGANISLVALPELAPIFQGLGAEVIEYSAELKMAQPDHWVLPLSIPRHLGVTTRNIPAAPYLTVLPERRERWAGYAPKGSVGIVWRGSAKHPNDRHRSLPSAELLKPLAAHANLVDLTEPIGDFADLAAVIEQLDLLVTVDTAAAHVAGALGKPVWALIPWFRTDWRWMQGREDTPWYPSMRLFRQPGPHTWPAVTEELISALAAR